MIARKSLIAIIFASFALWSGVSCISSVRLPLRIYPSDQTYIPIDEKSGCQVQFTPSLSYCSNTVFQTKSDAYECGAEDLGISPFYENGQEFRSNFLLGNSHIQATLDYTILDNDNSSTQSQLCFIKEQTKNDNIIDQLFKQGLIDEKKFYIDIQNIQHNTQSGSIDIGHPNYSSIKQGQQFTTLQPYTLNSGYDVASNKDFTYSDIKLIGGYSVNFSLGDPFLQIPAFTLNSIIKEFQVQGIQYTYTAQDNYSLYVNSIQNLKDISISLTAEDGSDFIITLKPEHYSRKLSNGKYQLLLYPTFYSSNVSIGYASLQAYYVGFDFKKQKVMIVEKQQNKINSQ